MKPKPKSVTPPPAPALDLAPAASDPSAAPASASSLSVTSAPVVEASAPAASMPSAGDAADDFSIQAAQARQEAWDLSRAPFFGDLALQPWSRERHSLALRLIEADVPALSLEDLARVQKRLVELAGAGRVGVPALEAVVDLGAYLPSAEKVLFLAAHRPEQFAHLRGPNVSRFFAVIAQWSEANIAPHQFEEACLTALQILTQWEKVTVMHQPDRRGGNVDLGN